MASLYEARNLPMESLYAPELLSIFVGVREFKVPHDLICSLSAYFKSAFDGDKWKEGQHGSTRVEDVEEWVFECFVNWLYTGRLFRKPSNTPCDYDHVDEEQGEQDAHERKQEQAHQVQDSKSNTAEATRCPGHFGVHSEGETLEDEENPITWPWRDLIALYLFADRYDTRGLRRAVMEAIQMKRLQNKPVDYDYPTLGDLAYAFNNLTAESPLHKFCLDAATYDYRHIRPRSAAKLEVLPPSILAVLVARHMQIADYHTCPWCTQESEDCRMPAHRDVKERFGEDHYLADVCSYHEHETTVEEQLCRRKWMRLDGEHELILACRRGL